MDWNRGFCGVTGEFPATATYGQLYTQSVPFVELNATQIPEEEQSPPGNVLQIGLCSDRFCTKDCKAFWQR